MIDDTMGWVPNLPWDVSHEVGPTWGVEWVLWDGSHGVGMQWVPGGVNLYHVKGREHLPKI